MNTLEVLLNIYILNMPLHFTMHCVHKHTHRALSWENMHISAIIQESKV